MLLAFWPVSAQVEGLTTNADGSVLYLSTSLRQKGTDQRHHPKIYRWSEAGGLELFAERERELNGHGINYFALSPVSLSTDGTTLAAAAGGDCWASSLNRINCLYNFEPWSGVIIRDGIAILEHGPGLPKISPNGRYATFSPTKLSASTPKPVSRPQHLIRSGRSLC